MEPEPLLSEPRPEGGVGVLDRPMVDPTLDGSHDKLSHLVIEGWHHRDDDDRWEQAQPDVVESMITGQPIIAMCGKVWVPTERGGRELCGTCREIAVRNGWKVPA